MSFVHLHCHSEYSLLDGANRIDDLITRAQLYEQPALAITDHGNMHAAWEFQEKARKAGVKPILGMEAYVAPGDRRTRGRPAPGVKPYYHLVLLARDLVGYRNLVKLSSLGYTEGFYSKPRIDRELLAAHSEGLIVSSACLAGEVASHLMDDRMEQAREAASWYAELFKDRYYLEVQAHTSEGQAKLNAKILSLGADLGLPVVATNDAHFLRHEDHDAHYVLLCIVGTVVFGFFRLSGSRLYIVDIPAIGHVHKSKKSGYRGKKCEIYLRQRPSACSCHRRSADIHDKSI